MEQFGRHNPHCGAEATGIGGAEAIYWNDIDSGLMQHAAARGEGIVTVDGSIAVDCVAMEGLQILDYLEPRLARNADKPVVLYVHEGAEYQL